MNFLDKDSKSEKKIWGGGRRGGIIFFYCGGRAKVSEFFYKESKSRKKLQNVFV